jgi:hypothetical protein
MAVDKKIFVKAFLITLALLLSVYSLNLYLNYEREKVIDERMREVVDEFEEFQALNALMEVYGQNATCMTLNSRIKLLDSNIWRLGDKIDNYRQLSREYMNDPYYQLQKQKFNRQEVIYLAILKAMKRSCQLNQTEILYFYQKGEECKTCDDQAYVLTYFNQRIDPEIAIFSFDADLNLPSVDVLRSLYNVTEYPCLVVEDSVYCGLRDKVELQGILCDRSGNSLSLCGINTNKTN